MPAIESFPLVVSLSKVLKDVHTATAMLKYIMIVARIGKLYINLPFMYRASFYRHAGNLCEQQDIIRSKPTKMMKTTNTATMRNIFEKKLSSCGSDDV